MDAVICAICVFLLVAWVRDHRRDQQRRRRWHLSDNMSVEDELERRRQWLDDIDRDR
jgi:hypothetical protein